MPRPTGNFLKDRIELLLQLPEPNDLKNSFTFSVIQCLLATELFVDGYLIHRFYEGTLENSPIIMRLLNRILEYRHLPYYAK